MKSRIVPLLDGFSLVGDAKVEGRLLIWERIERPKRDAHSLRQETHHLPSIQGCAIKLDAILGEKLESTFNSYGAASIMNYAAVKCAVFKAVAIKIDDLIREYFVHKVCHLFASRGDSANPTIAKGGAPRKQRRVPGGSIPSSPDFTEHPGTRRRM